MARVVVAEDEDPIREEILSLLADHNSLTSIEAVADGGSLKRLLKKGEVDLALLDIELPVQQTLDVLSEVTNPPVLIFITAFDEYVSDAFKMGAVDYLVKPFTRERLYKAIDRALNAIEKAQDRKGFVENLWLKDEIERVIPVQAKSIKFLKADNKNCVIYSDKGVFNANKTLRAVLASLDPSMFIQIHRSYVVNIASVSHVEYLSQNYAELTIKKTGEVLPVSRRHLKLLRANRF